MILDRHPRIERRLRIQHARWLLRQPGFHSPLRNICRRLLRWYRRRWRTVFRWGLLFCQTRLGRTLTWVCGVPLGLVAIVLVGALVCVVPSLLLELPPERLANEGTETRVNVALIRLACMLSWAAVFAVLMSPGNKQGMFVDTDQGRTTSTSGGRRLSGAPAMSHRPNGELSWFSRPRNLARMMSVLGLVCFAALGGIIWDVEGDLADRVMAMLLTVGWLTALACLVWQLCIWLMRFRVRRFAGVDLWRWSTVVWGLLSLALLIGFLSPQVHRVHLSLVGPFGFFLDKIREVAGGQWNDAGLICLSGVAMIAVSPLLNRKAGAYRNCRRIVTAQRHQSATDAGFKNRLANTRESSDPLGRLAKVRHEIGASLPKRKLFRWQTWILPVLIRRRIAWFAVIVPAVWISLAIVTAIGVVISRAESVAVLGGEAIGNNPELRMVMLIVLHACLMIAVVEVVALYDRYEGQNRTFAQRPISVGRAWLELQQEGLTRLPFQLLLAIPATMPLMIWSESLHWQGLRNVALVIFAGLILLRTWVIGGEVDAATRVVLPPLVQAGLSVITGALGMAIAVCVMATVASLQGGTMPTFVLASLPCTAIAVLLHFAGMVGLRRRICQVR